jgi:hypothetical protein
MAVSDPVSVPQKKITSVDVNGFSGGLNLNGEQSAGHNQLVESRDTELTVNGLLTIRKSLEKWLPDTVGDVYEVFPALIDNVINFFTVDNGKVKWCLIDDSSWTECGGSNFPSTGNGGKPTFLRVSDVLLILNGGNGDRLSFVDLSTKNVVLYTYVPDPTATPTIVPTGITNSGSYRVYYGYTYSSTVGQTKLSPIMTYTVNKPRDTWASDGSEYLTISRPGTAPAGATSWNLYIALHATGGIIQDSDTLMLIPGLDLNTNSVVDNGTLAIDIGRGTPPSDNSTAGPRVDRGIEANGRPILHGDMDNPYNIWIGGDGEFALDFSPSNGGFRSEPSKGTNFYPDSIIGFRNGVGVPSLSILFSNTQGVSKQAILEQQTINYGTQSFVVWGVTEQNYGAAGVASPYGVVNYNGELLFPSTDGFMAISTQPQLQNVLATKRISEAVSPYVRRIKTSALKEIVGTAWDNKLMWLIPAYGFEKPTDILIRDLNNGGAWIIQKIAAQWIGTISPPDHPAFVYICQGNKILRLFDSFGTVDYKGGAAETFSTKAVGALIGINEAHNAYKALVQAIFYFIDFIGTVTIGVNYRNESGRIKSKSRTYHGPEYTLTASGGWSDVQYNYAHFDTPARWSDVSRINLTALNLERLTKRIPLRLNVLASEVQWWIETPNGYSDYILKSVVFEGENIGIKPDIR